MKKNLLLLCLMFCLPVLLFAQTDKKEDAWKDFKYFVGAWEGTGKGEPGESKVEREYDFTLGRQFLQAKNKSIYAPQEKNPKGEIHEDFGLFSFDKSRKKHIFRQFHVEGFVNQYVLKSVSEDGKKLVFETESIENIPAGWRARETYQILNKDEFTETFELAAPGKDFEVYTLNKFRRKIVKVVKTRNK